MASPILVAGEKVDEVVDTKAKGKVEINVMNGDVTIHSWDKNQVKVVGELDDKAEGYQFEAHGNGQVTFKVNMPKNRWNNNYYNDKGSQLEIWLPKSNKLRFEGVNVNVTASKINGGTMINTVNGDIAASELSKRVHLETVNGTIDAKSLSDKISLNTVNGKVLDNNSVGSIEIETVNGDITSTSKAEEVNISNVNGDIDLMLQLVHELEISTVNGDIDGKLELADDARFYVSTVGGDADIEFTGKVSASFNIEAHAGGDITNKLTKDKVKKAKYGPGESLRFSTGGGEAEVEMSTVSGDITIKK